MSYILMLLAKKYPAVLIALLIYKIYAYTNKENHLAIKMMIINKILSLNKKQ